MSARRLVVSLAAATAVLAGCHSIKLDPLDPQADVYVNGELKGRGQVEYVTPKYSTAGDIGVKVVPASGQPYTVTIERQFDWNYVVINSLISAGVGLAWTAVNLEQHDFPFGLFILAEAPISFLQGYRVEDYYDLSKLKAEQNKAGALGLPLTVALQSPRGLVAVLPQHRVLGYATMPDYASAIALADPAYSLGHNPYAR